MKPTNLNKIKLIVFKKISPQRMRKGLPGTFKSHSLDGPLLHLLSVF